MRVEFVSSINTVDGQTKQGTHTVLPRSLVEARMGGMNVNQSVVRIELERPTSKQGTLHVHHCRRYTPR